MTTMKAPNPEQATHYTTDKTGGTYIVRREQRGLDGRLCWYFDRQDASEISSSHSHSLAAARDYAAMLRKVYGCAVSFA